MGVCGEGELDAGDADRGGAGVPEDGFVCLGRVAADEVERLEGCEEDLCVVVSVGLLCDLVFADEVEKCVCCITSQTPAQISQLNSFGFRINIFLFVTTYSA